MNKKLMAVAVAGALAVPTLAFSQMPPNFSKPTTVEIYGFLNVGYNYFDPGPGRPKTDALNQHGSNIGVRGQEDLGGGTAAWFQCETTADVRGVIQSGFCSRDSAVGFKGGFGNVWLGLWDTSKNLISFRPIRFWSKGSAFGSGELLWNTSTANSTNRQQPASFDRRQANLISYATTNIKGFQARGSFSSSNEATAETSASVASKPRLYSLSLTYANGPVYLGAGYEKHRNYNPAGQSAALYTGGNDRNWELVGAYTFANANNSKVSFIYTDKQYAVTNGTSLGHKAFAIFGDLQISGPHAIRMGFTNASDTTGNATARVGTLVANASAGGTGARMYAADYMYTFSKRTQVSFGYVQLENDRNAIYRLQTLGTSPPAGKGQNALVAEIWHRF